MASWRASSEGCAAYAASIFIDVCVRACVCVRETKPVNANGELIFDLGGRGSWAH